MPTKTVLTLNDAGCYADGSRGIYAIDAIREFAYRFNLPTSIVACMCDGCKENTMSMSGCEFADEIEDDIDSWLNENTTHEGMYWGRNENSDWGLWEIEDDTSADNSCNQCIAMMINNVYCHETGCPNRNKIKVDGEWITPEDDTEED